MTNPDSFFKKQQKLQDLQDLMDRWSGCKSCNLYLGRTKMVHFRGSVMPRVVFVGEGPGISEDLEGVPFVGLAGKLLDRIILASELPPENYAIANCVACRPPENRNPFPAEFKACSSRLCSLLDILDPAVLVLLGLVPLKMLVPGTQGGITANRGDLKCAFITNSRNEERQFMAIPTFHPSYLLRNGGFNSRFTSDVIKDIQRAAYIGSRRQY